MLSPHPLPCRRVLVCDWWLVALRQMPLKRTRAIRNSMRYRLLRCEDRRTRPILAKRPCLGTAPLARMIQDLPRREREPECLIRRTIQLAAYRILHLERSLDIKCERGVRSSSRGDQPRVPNSIVLCEV